MKKSSLKFFFITLLCAVCCTAIAQDISVELGPDKVPVNNTFIIKVTIKNGKLKNYTDFPTIEGFAKRGTSSSSNTNIVNGQISSSQSIIQRYMPLEQGSFKLNPFTMEVNGKTISSEGKTIEVTEAEERRRTNTRRRSPFDDVFGTPKADPEFVDVKEDAFLALTTDKSEVYLGEGFTMTFAFYVADANRAPLQFNDAGKQLSTILKELRPQNCWEENFNIENIYGERVTIGGANYTRYKIYQAAYFPLNLEPVHFKSVPFEMIKYKVAKSPSFFGRDRQEDFKTFYTKAKTVKVKALPPHPLKDLVAVGQFSLDEKIDKSTVETGSSFEYEFNIFGEGNIAGINDPIIPENKDIDFYPPNTSQDVNRGNGKVSGSKKYSYFGIPNEPGNYEMKDYFSWVYFDPELAKYDTLTSEVKINVTGESKKNVSISSTDLGSFYDGLDLESNKIQSLRGGLAMQILANILILAMLGGATFMYFKK
jgi:oxygen tolerance protein BatD